VGRKDIGVATASVTFFRQLGGTLGVAVFLSIVYSTVGGKISHAYAAAQSSPAFDAAAKANPSAVSQLRSASSSALNNTSFLQSFSATLTEPFRQGFTESLTVCFVIGAVVLAIGFVLTFFLREVPLRTTAAAFEQDKPEVVLPQH
jgi:nucleoside recognition membrane protein YjiH